MIREIDIIFINICRNPKTWHWCSYETLFTLFEFKGFSTWGERGTHNLSMLTAFTSSALNPPNARRPWRTNSSGLAQLWISTLAFGGRNSTHWLFPNLKILSPHFQAWRHSPPWSYFLSGVLFWHLWMPHPLRARTNTCIN